MLNLIPARIAGFGLTAKCLARLHQERRPGHALENTLVFFLFDNGASAEIMVRGDDQTDAPNALLQSRRMIRLLQQVLAMLRVSGQHG